MNLPLWSEQQVTDFLTQTVGREALPKTPGEAVKYARASALVIIAEYEKRHMKCLEDMSELIDTIDNLLAASTLRVSPEIHAEGLRVGLQAVRTSLAIIYTDAGGNDVWGDA